MDMITLFLYIPDAFLFLQNNLPDLADIKRAEQGVFFVLMGTMALAKAAVPFSTACTLTAEHPGPEGERPLPRCPERIDHA
jgi:hypothetical protein